MNIEERKNENIAGRKNSENIGDECSFLKEQIGKIMRIEFLIGTNMLKERIGVLEDVLKEYVILRALESDTLIYCKTKDIKFINMPTSGYSNMPPMNSRYPYY